MRHSASMSQNRVPLLFLLVLDMHCVSPDFSDRVSMSSFGYSNQGSVSLQLASSSNECTGVFNFVDGASIVEDLQYNLCEKLNNLSASLIQSRHLISNTNYPENEVYYLHPRKWDVTKTHLERSPSVVKNFEKSRSREIRCGNDRIAI